MYVYMYELYMYRIYTYIHHTMCVVHVHCSLVTSSLLGVRVGLPLTFTCCPLMFMSCPLTFMSFPLTVMS